MITNAQILADSFSLVKYDPRGAEATLNPAPPGSAAARTIQRVTSLAAKSTPSMKIPPTDPCGQLQRSLSDVLYGVAWKGPALSEVVDLTNRHCPMTKTYLLLRSMTGMITDICEIREGVFSDWSVEQAKVIGTRPSGRGPGSVRIGYRIDAPRLRDAVDDLARVADESTTPDPRRRLAYACYCLVASFLRQFRAHLDRAGDNWLEMLADEKIAGRYTIRVIEPQDAPLVVP